MIPGRDDAGNGGTVTIHMPSGMNAFDSSNPVMAREWKKMFEDLTGRRVIPQVGR